MRKLLGFVALALLAGGCAGPAPTSTPARSGPAAPAAAEPATPEPGHTCPATGEQIPAGAHQAPTADVDYDAKPDTLWLADVDGKRLVGVRTASGATFSTTFTASGSRRVSALAQKMSGADAPSVVILDAGGSVKLYTVADCAIVPTTNPRHEQYVFGGTGVECPAAGSGYSLAGLEAEPAGGGETVYRTPVTLSDYGRHASDASRQTVASGVDQDSDVARHANSVTCGTDNPAVTE